VYTVPSWWYQQKDYYWILSFPKVDFECRSLRCGAPDTDKSSMEQAGIDYSSRFCQTFGSPWLKCSIFQWITSSIQQEGVHPGPQLYRFWSYYKPEPPPLKCAYPPLTCHLPGRYIKAKIHRCISPRMGIFLRYAQRPSPLYCPFYSKELLWSTS
jgi:hypothetical protein